MPIADAKAIVPMLDSNILQSCGDCDVPGKTSPSKLDSSSGASQTEHAAFVISLKDISESARDGMKSAVKISKKTPRPAVNVLYGRR